LSSIKKYSIFIRIICGVLGLLGLSVIILKIVNSEEFGFELWLEATVVFIFIYVAVVGSNPLENVGGDKPPLYGLDLQKLPFFRPVKKTLGEQGGLTVPESAYNNEINPNINKTKIYSPNQVACGTIGGPIGLIYFLHSNFATLGNDRLKKNTLVYGVVFLIAEIIAMQFIPDEAPNELFTILNIAIARLIAEEYQMTKSAIVESNEFEFHSNWRVLFFGLLCLIGLVLVFLGALYLILILITSGFLEPQLS